MHDHGTFTPASAVPAPPVAADQSDLERPTFPTTRRGYEPSAVDTHLTRLEEHAVALRSALEDSERRRTMAEQHALAVEDEIRAVRGGLIGAMPQTSDTGFGARAERLLRLAETEAEQIRAVAQRSAGEVTQRAAGEAEQHRHDVRQHLIAESARAEEQAARRTAELQDREDVLRVRMERAQAEADAIRSTARQAADAHRSAAQADVAELRNRSAYELKRVRDLEERELRRLRDLQGTARLELTRLASVIRAELPTSIPRPSPGPGRGSGRAAAQAAGQGRADDADRGGETVGPGARPSGSDPETTRADADPAVDGPMTPMLRILPEAAAVATI